MIDLCYYLALTLRCVAVDGDKFSFTVSLRPVLIQPPSQIDYRLDKMYSCECRWVKFIRGADVMSGGAPMYHDHCMQMSS